MSKCAITQYGGYRIKTKRKSRKTRKTRKSRKSHSKTPSKRRRR